MFISAVVLFEMLLIDFLNYSDVFTFGDHTFLDDFYRFFVGTRKG